MVLVSVTFGLDADEGNQEAWEDVFDALMDVGAEDIKIEGLSD